MIEEIIKYLDGELDDVSLASFEARLRQDEKLKAEVDAVKISKKLSAGIIEAEIVGYIRNFKASKNETEVKNIAPKSNMRKLYFFGGAVAAACALLFFYVNFNASINDLNANRDVYAKYYSNPMWPAVRSENKQWEMMIARYLAVGDKDIINNLISSDILDKDHLEKKYWAAEILLKEKRFSEAAGIADDLIKSKVHLSRCHYIKVMHLLSTNQKEAMISYINSVPKEDLEKEEVLMFEELKK